MGLLSTVFICLLIVTSSKADDDVVSQNTSIGVRFVGIGYDILSGKLQIIFPNLNSLSSLDTTNYDV